MSKFILTDVDGVLVNWGEGFENWFRYNHLKYGVQLPTTELKSSLNIEDWLGMTYDETRQMVKDFNNDPDYFPYLNPFDDALEYVEKLKNEGYSFVAISACNTDSWHMEARKGNLERYFPNTFDTIHLVEIGASKKKFLSRYKSTWWVEDHPRHAEDAALLGHMSFLINRPYNVKTPTTYSKRVSGWQSIYSCITDEGCSHPNWIA